MVYVFSIVIYFPMCFKIDKLLKIPDEKIY